MSLVRILRTSLQTLTHQFFVDEVLTDAAGSVTATLKRLDGTTVNSATAGHPGTGTYTYTVPGQATLDTLTLDWTGTLAGAAVSIRDDVEIVGGFLFGLGDARAAHQFVDATTSTDRLADLRIEIEQEFERICRQAFVPRFDREVLDGRDTDRLPTRRSMLRAIRAVTIGGVAMSAPDVAALGFTDHGTILRPFGAIWPAGRRNIAVEYEHGLDYPPEEIRSAAILRLRSKLSLTSSGIPDRALSYNTPDGNTFRLSTPSRQRVGVPEIDGVLERYTRPLRVVFA